MWKHKWEKKERKYQVIKKQKNKIISWNWQKKVSKEYTHTHRQTDRQIDRQRFSVLSLSFLSFFFSSSWMALMDILMLKKRKTKKEKSKNNSETNKKNIYIYIYTQRIKRFIFFFLLLLFLLNVCKRIKKIWIWK